jgi:hypothetical protein
MEVEISIGTHDQEYLDFVAGTTLQGQGDFRAL